MAMKKLVTILEVEDRTSKKSGNKYRVAQCIVKGENIRVGELMVFKPEIKVAPGDFEAEFDVTVNFERQVSAELIALNPVKASTRAGAST